MSGRRAQEPVSSPVSPLAGTGLDRSLPPPPGAIRPFRFPAFRRHRLANGLTVFAARFGAVPLVSIELMTPAGGEHDPPQRFGLATLTASLLDEGTARRDALAIAAFAERVGGYLTTGADWNVGYVATGLLSPHRRAGLELLAEVATAPTFPEREIERLRRQRLSELLRRAQDPSTLADDRLTAAIYGDGVYAMPLVGRTESVEALTREEIVAFYQRHYALSGSALLAVGDLDPEAMIAEVEAVLGDQPPGEAPASPAIDPAPLPGLSIDVVDRPGAAQTELRLGHVGISRRSPDYIPVSVLNTLLGGKFTSRINLNLRERHGFTYGASTRFVARLGAGPFVFDTGVATESTGAAVREVLAELRRIREEPVDPIELVETRNYLLGVFPYTVQTLSDVAKRLELIATYSLPDDYFDHYAERLDAVTAEDLLRVAREYLHPDRMAVVAVGPAAELAPQLAGLGPVRIVGSGEPATPA